MRIQGCSQHADTEYTLAFPTFAITANVFNEITFDSMSTSKDAWVEFNEETCTMIPTDHQCKALYSNNLQRNYMAPIKSTIVKNNHEFLQAQATPHSVGYNIHAITDTSIPPNSCKAISTSLSMAIPPGLYGRLAPRSGLALKHHIDVGEGVIDPDFRGEIKVLLINSSQRKFTIE
eukprot:11163400-Ditylum_brightwellii.AAC.1